MSTYPKLVVTGTTPENVNLVESTVWSIYQNSSEFRNVLDNVAARYSTVVIDVSAGNGYSQYHGFPAYEASFSGQDKTNSDIYRIALDPSVTSLVTIDGIIGPATVESLIAHEFSHSAIVLHGETSQDPFFTTGRRP
jgi:hypothetical protein